MLGPYSTRDAIGRAGDVLTNPLTYVDETELVYGALALDYINDSPENLDNYYTLKQASLDPYVSAKDAYVQYRNRKLAK